ncbi:MAG: stage III sporulation protein AE [Acutalibacteraceae bacterium]
MPETMELTGTLASMMLFLTPVSGLIESACEGIRQGTGILLGGVPVLCGILTASGHTFSGSTLSILTVAAGNVGSLLASAFLVPVLQAFLALSSISCLYPKLRLQAFCSALLKAVRWTLVFVVSIYSALLSMQGSLASSADAASLKAVRLSVSSFVPVVGSAVSDAISAVQASLGLLRGGLGSFAILTLLYLCRMIAGGLWIFASCLLGGACELFSLSQVKPFFTSCRDVLQTLLAFQISFCVVAVTSFALLLSTGGTGG